MASTLDPAPWFVAWVEDRVADLAGKVFPHSAPPAGRVDPPYALYSEIHAEPVGSINAPGRAGLSLVVYQLDVIDFDRDTATAIANAITGTVESPGLHRLSGLWSRDGYDDLFVQCATLSRPGAADQWEPEHGKSAGEYVVSRDYEIWLEERLRPA